MINAGNDFVDSDDEELGAKVTVHHEQRDREDEFQAVDFHIPSSQLSKDDFIPFEVCKDEVFDLSLKQDGLESPRSSSSSDEAQYEKDEREFYEKILVD